MSEDDSLTGDCVDGDRLVEKCVIEDDSLTAVVLMVITMRRLSAF